MITRASQTHSKANAVATATGAVETAHIVSILENKRRGGKRFRPFAGSVAYCSRQNWFYANQEAGESVTPATLNLYQGIGNGVEERIVSGLHTHGILYGSQVRLANPPKNFGIDVGGYIDAIALDSKGVLSAYEIKTCSSLPPSPKPNHLSQAMTYAALGGLDSVYVVYVGRQVQAFPDPTPLVKAFRIDVGALLPEYMAGIVMTCHALTSKEAPQRPPTFRKSSECSYCDFAEACWKDSNLKVMTSSKNALLVAEAEKTAEELIALRPSFYAEQLANCVSTCPEENQDKLKVMIREANERNKNRK